MKRFLLTILLIGTLTVAAQSSADDPAERARIDSMIAADPQAAVKMVLNLARTVGRKSPAGYEEWVATVAEKAAAIDAEAATDAARYIANNYLIVYADPVAANPWVDRYLRWSGDPDYEPRITRFVKQAMGEIECDDFGKQMPDYELYGLDGAKMKLSDLRGQFVLIDFWASWCGPCRAEVPHVKAAREAFKDAPIKFVSISSDKDDDAWRRAAAEIDVPWLHLSSNGTDMLKAYGVMGIPRIMVLDPEGRLVADQLTGRTIEHQLANLAKRYDW